MLLRTYLKTSDPVDRWLLWILIGLIAAGVFISLQETSPTHAAVPSVLHCTLHSCVHSRRGSGTRRRAALDFHFWSVISAGGTFEARIRHLCGGYSFGDEGKKSDFFTRSAAASFAFFRCRRPSFTAARYGYLHRAICGAPFHVHRVGRQMASCVRCLAYRPYRTCRACVLEAIS